MTDYEITLLTKTETDKNAVKELIGKVGGEIADEKPLGQRTLAYPIKKERQAHITLVRFRMDPEQVLTLNKDLLLSGDLLRHMITTARTKVPATAASILAKSRPTERVEITKAKEDAPAEPAKKAKKTKLELKQEAQAVKERQKKIEAELEKILSEE